VFCNINDLSRPNPAKDDDCDDTDLQVIVFSYTASMNDNSE